jgi:hypothetical protein
MHAVVGRAIADSLPAMVAAGAVIGGTILVSEHTGPTSAAAYSNSLTFQPQSFAADVTSAPRLFQQLQHYRSVAPSVFDAAGSEYDSLLRLRCHTVRQPYHSVTAARHVQALRDHLDALRKQATRALYEPKRDKVLELKTDESKAELRRSLDDVRTIAHLIRDIVQCARVHERVLARDSFVFSASRGLVG